MRVIWPNWPEGESQSALPRSSGACSRVYAQHQVRSCSQPLDRQISLQQTLSYTTEAASYHDNVSKYENHPQLADFMGCADVEAVLATAIEDQTDAAPVPPLAKVNNVAPPKAKIDRKAGIRPGYSTLFDESSSESED